MSYWRYIYYTIIVLVFASCNNDGATMGTAEDWLIFRGSPTLNGYTDRALPENPQMKWNFVNNVRTVASPIIRDGIAYTCDRNGVIRGIDRNGQQCFEYDTETTIEASFIIQDTLLYIGRIDGFVNAISLNSKSVLWEFETEGQISGSPNIIKSGKNTKILVGSYDNNMYTLDAADGSEQSRFETGYYINGATALWKQYMIFGGCDAWVRMVNTEDGQVTDSLKLKAYVPASPAVAGDFAYISDYNGNLYGIEIENGKFKSHRTLIEVEKGDEDGGVVSMPTVTNDAIYVLSGDKKINCIDRKTGETRWSKLLRGDTGESAPLVCRDKILVCTKDGHASILNCSDGKELWHYEIGEQIIASPAIIKGGFYILTSRGKLFYFE